MPLLLGMPRVIDLGALRQEALTTALTPAGETGAPRFGTHARAETVLTFAGALGWLVSAFHN